MLKHKVDLHLNSSVSFSSSKSCDSAKFTASESVINGISCRGTITRHEPFSKKSDCSVSLTKNNDDAGAAHLISNIELGSGGKVEKDFGRAKPESQTVENPDCTSSNVPEYALKTGLEIVPDYDDILQYAERVVCGDLSDFRKKSRRQRSHDVKWLEMFHRLVLFKVKNNHSQVPQYFPENQEFGNWCANNRLRILEWRDGRATPNLSDSRLKLLLSIGFFEGGNGMKPTVRTNQVKDESDVLSGSDNDKSKEKNDCILDNNLRRDKMPIQKIDLIKEGKTENTDSNITLMQSYTTTSKSIVMPTRSAEDKSQLEDKRRRKDELLSRIENDPSVSKRHRSKNMKWGDFYRRLEDFKIAFGHCNVPNLYPPDNALGKFVDSQREQYRLMKEGKTFNGTGMTEEKVQLLDSISFIWDVEESRDRHRTACSVKLPLQELTKRLDRKSSAQIPLESVSSDGKLHESDFPKIPPTLNNDIGYRNIVVSIDSLMEKYNCALEDAKARPFKAVSHDLFVFKTGNFRKRVERTLKPRIVLKNIKKRKETCEAITERERLSWNRLVDLQRKDNVPFLPTSMGVPPFFPIPLLPTLAPEYCKTQNCWRAQYLFAGKFKSFGFYGTLDEALRSQMMINNVLYLHLTSHRDVSEQEVECLLMNKICSGNNSTLQCNSSLHHNTNEPHVIFNAMDEVKSGTSTSTINGQRNLREGHDINGCMKKQSQKDSNDLVKKDMPREEKGSSSKIFLDLKNITTTEGTPSLARGSNHSEVTPEILEMTDTAAERNDHSLMDANSLSPKPAVDATRGGWC